MRLRITTPLAVVASDEDGDHLSLRAERRHRQLRDAAPPRGFPLHKPGDLHRKPLAERR